MDNKEAQKLGYMVNTVILSTGIVFLMLFIKMNTTILVFSSIGILQVYVLNYYLLYKGKLDEYLWLTYISMIAYTGLTTICLGQKYCFYLYSYSMAACAFTMKYMAYKLNRKDVRALPLGILVGVAYLVAMAYTSKKGTIYDTTQYASFFSMCNSTTVLGYIIVYTDILIKAVINSENKLEDMAHKDNLTGLYNRHYMMEQLSSIEHNDREKLLAIVDIDDFKHINDTYGHSSGDIVLQEISNRMKKADDNFVVARWGGEEFLILCNGNKEDSLKALEKMHKEICSNSIKSGDVEIKVSVTIGVSARSTDESIDSWLREADRLLYIGKNSGKSKIVHS